MASMSVAALGWGVWWVGFLLARLAPEHAPSPLVVYALSTPLALLGLALAVLCVRARLAWVLLTGIPFLANLSLAVMPLLLPRGGGVLGG